MPPPGRTDGERIAVLESRFADLTGDIAELKQTAAHIDAKLDARPSWWIGLYLTTCTSAVVGLAVYLASTHH